MRHAAMIFLLVVIGGLSRVAEQNPTVEGTVEQDCSVFELGNKSFVRCTFLINVKDNRTNFSLLYRNIGAPKHVHAELAFSCYWSSAEPDKPKCSGSDGYILNDTAIGSSVTIEVPRKDLQAKEYTCRLANAEQASARSCCAATTTSTTTTTTTTTPKHLDEPKDNNASHYMLSVAVVVLGVLLVTGVIAIIVWRLVRKSRRRSSRPSQDAAVESGIRVSQLAFCNCFGSNDGGQSIQLKRYNRQDSDSEDESDRNPNSRPPSYTEETVFLGEDGDAHHSTKNESGLPLLSDVKDGNTMDGAKPIAADPAPPTDIVPVDISRSDAEERLLRSEVPVGTFILRRSQGKCHWSVLAVKRSDDEVSHHLVKEEEDFYKLDVNNDINPETLKFRTLKGLRDGISTKEGLFDLERFRDPETETSGEGVWSCQVM